MAYLKNILSILTITICITACNSTAEEKPVTKNKKDTTIILADPVAVPLQVTLKDAALNEKNLLGNNRLQRSKRIDREAYKMFSIMSIDSAGTGDNGFRYYIIDTLYSNPGLKILLIGRAYESENYAWITIYDDQNKLLDHKTVYYDNAEGFMSVETIIKNNQLTITTLNDFAEQEKEKKRTEVYHLNESNRIVKL